MAECTVDYTEHPKLHIPFTLITKRTKKHRVHMP
jgi:hypothetical protein